MTDQIPSTSSDNDMEFDGVFIARATRMSIAELKEELRRLEAGDHPLLKTARRKVQEDARFDEDRITHHRQFSSAKYASEFATKEKTVDEEFGVRLDSARDESRKRVDELERLADVEFSSNDINKTAAVAQQFESNKKTLRGRGGHLIEPASYFNCNQNAFKVPDCNFELALKEARIRQDLTEIDPQRVVAQRVFSVLIQKPRLVVENKTFKHGEEVEATNGVYHHFLAKVDIVSDRVVLLKGAHSWDTRQITASITDLETGRVVVTKHQKGRN